MDISETFWNDRYLNKDTGWDLGAISTPLKKYFDQLNNKEQRILIPGGGNAHEAEYLHELGFINVFVVDVSEKALSNFKARVPSFPVSHVIHNNFFELNMRFDLIIEQTFFCAIDPSLRPKYVEQAHQLLNANGKIVGLLFNAPLYEDRPPFGGHKDEYLEYFQPLFNIEVMEPAYNSEESRTGKELFVKLLKI